MGIITVTTTTTGGTRIQDFAWNVVTILRTMLLLWSSTIVAADTEMLVFPLARTNATSVVNEYAVKIQLGTIGYSPSVYLLPVFYASEYYNAKNGGPKPLYVPSVELCLDQKEQAEWNQFVSPEEGELVNTAAPYTVVWQGSANTKEVNLSLRKGNGAKGKNLTVIDMGITNNGMYKWKAAKTKQEQNIGDDVEVSLMLWTDNPPQRSYSPAFTMRNIKGSNRLAIRGSSSPPGSKAYNQCMRYLLNNGGVYNDTEDRNFKVDNRSDGVGIFTDPVSGWEVKITNTGSTTVTYETQDIGGNGLKNVTVTEMGVNLIKADTQGMGIVALSEVQRIRNMEAGKSGDQTTNVVAMYLGSGTTPGQVVMGGYDKELIDQTQGSAVYGKRNLMDGQFEVQLVGITYIPDVAGRTPEKGIIDEVAISMTRTQLRLSFNSPTIYLPDVILQDLLPHLGAPVYSNELNGYLYEASPKTDYSLRFTLANSTLGNFVNITIPASSLVTRETTNDNPITDKVVESGREFLLLAPLRGSNGGIGYLGRAFLQHVYMVDDSYLDKFFISAINTTAVKKGSSSLMTGSMGLMNSTPVDIPPRPEASTSSGTSDTDHISKSSTVGAILGSVIGSIAIVWLFFLFYYLRKKRQLNSQLRDDDVEDGEKTLERGIVTVFGSGGKMGVQRVDSRPSGEDGQFDNDSKEVDFPPGATFLRGKQPISTIHQPNSACRGMPSPLITYRDAAPPGRWVSFTDNPPVPPPPPPAKDEQYFRTAALARKRFSQPLMKGPYSPSSPQYRKRRSDPTIALESTGEGSYLRHLHSIDSADGLHSPFPIPTYHQLLAHHQARRHRDSYLDSDSSNLNENDANTTKTSSSETATVGKVISKGQVAKIRQLSSTPPHAALANTLERRASVGRVISPGEVVVVPPSRRASRSSRELLFSPRQSIGLAGSSGITGESSAEGVAVGHRRGKSAPSDLDFPFKAPRSPPPRAKDDIFIRGIRTVGGRASRRGQPSSPHPRAIDEHGLPITFFDSSPEDGVSSSSSTALPKAGQVLKRNESESSEEKEHSPVSPVSERGEEVDFRSQDSRVSAVSPVTPPPLEKRFS